VLASERKMLHLRIQGEKVDSDVLKREKENLVGLGCGEPVQNDVGVCLA